ncbi:hypothetical protein QO003_002063 [Arthrobacter silviterrae]|uniref:Uncharacterized protein n=1 Tax=Arthrobacter silviterrae TaxID=2026658 RepID=A0ABX0DG21_9MICC|nr:MULTISPECIES: hypothetical protein [Arthrobacter]MCU6482714.1 hypothetical protein [Arthrobacter sp. A2-55]MDQ0277760.1 hypothetical protein [Arthrobacter silviterrae]NGN85568.1 hypothetical protein [Arthrobacter silviterrae]
MKTITRTLLGMVTAGLLCFVLAVPGAQANDSVVPDGSALLESATSPVEMGWIDPASLNIVGFEGPATSSAASPAELAKFQTALPQLPATQRSGIQPLTTQPNCAGRIDFYRWVLENGTTYCFANAGELYASPGVWGVRYLCPGNNVGRTLYQDGVGVNMWSLWRGPMANYNTCYDFGGPVAGKGLQIQ